MSLLGFLEEPAHPESDSVACTAPLPNAVPLSPALDGVDAECISVLGLAGRFVLCLTEPSMPCTVVTYESVGLSGWEKTGSSYTDFDNKSIRSMRMFLVGRELHLVYCTEDQRCTILKRDTSREWGKVCDLGQGIGEASIFIDKTKLWLLYGTCKIRELKPDLKSFAGEPMQIAFNLDNIRGALNLNSKKHLDYSHSHSPCVMKIDGLYHMMFTDTHRRFQKDNQDTFIAVSDHIQGPYSRRYLTIPNGGAADFFSGPGQEPHAAFIGAADSSAVFRKPAIVRLERSPTGYLMPDTNFIYENSSVDAVRPALGIEVRDTFIFCAPDDKYYLTGTSRRPNGTFWNRCDGIHVWSSDNLDEWNHVAKVFDYLEQPDSWQNHNDSPHNTWAPEISFFAGTFWITYSMTPGFALLKSASGRIEGPYLDMGRYISNRIDSGFFIDDDGTVYVVYQNGMIAPLSQDGSRFAEDPRMLMPTDGQEVGYEGAGIIKILGKYVLYAAEWNGDSRLDGTYDMMFSWADSLDGPYCPRKVLVPHGGHGCLFKDRQGDVRYTLFGNDRTAPFRRGVGIGRVFSEIIGQELSLRI